MFLYAILAFICFVLVIKWLKQKLKTNGGKPMPSHQGLPLIGSALEFDETNAIFEFDNMYKRYGEIFSLNVFGQNMVVLSSERMIREAFCSSQYSKHFNNKPSSFFGKYFRNNSESVAFYRYHREPLYHQLKKTFMGALHAYGTGIKAIEDNVLLELENVLGKLDRSKGEDFNYNLLVKRSLTNIMSLALIGETMPEGDPDEDLFWQKVDALMFFVTPYIESMMSLFPFLRYIPGTKFSKMYHYGNQVNKTFVDRFFYSVRNDQDKRHSTGIVDYYLKQQREDKLHGRDPFLTDERIKSQLIEIIDAGIVTSWCFLVNAMVILVNYPEIQTKIQEELDRVIGVNRSPTFNDRPKCHFMMAFEKEVHRLMPAVPLLLPHYCEEDVVLKGYSIPGNSIIIPNIWSVHHDEKVWSDPWNVRPERFLDEHGSILPSEHILIRSVLSFGVGERKCSGETFAKTRSFLFLSSILQRYSFQFSDGSQRRSCDPRDVEDFDISLLLKVKSLNIQAIQRV